jgi:hypothetical protein
LVDPVDFESNLIFWDGCLENERDIIGNHFENRFPSPVLRSEQTDGARRRGRQRYIFRAAFLVVPKSFCILQAFWVIRESTTMAACDHPRRQRRISERSAAGPGGGLRIPEDGTRRSISLGASFGSGTGLRGGDHGCARFAGVRFLTDHDLDVIILE